MNIKKINNFKPKSFIYDNSTVNSILNKSKRLEL